tara:strand:+ start:781 stop:1044 length:264 start_codon:yes stop_codon:yes gene_type:complete
MFNYSGLFGGVVVEEDDITQGPAAPKFSDRWKWFSIIERLAKGDVTKFEKVYAITYITALNTLSYWKERDDYQERLQKRQDMMNKHK